MSDTDSFVDEVSEELRRDRLFALFRRYGWIAVLAVLALVGGTAWNEWRKAQATQAAQDRGDAIYEALSADDNALRAASLANLPDSGPAGQLLQGAALMDAGDPGAAASLFASVASDMSVDPLYRDLAALKSAMIVIPDQDAETRRAALASLAVPGGAFRLLAMEQMALIDLEQGNREAAIAGMKSVLEDASISAAQRDRAQSLIVSLGGVAE